MQIERTSDSCDISPWKNLEHMLQIWEWLARWIGGSIIPAHSVSSRGNGKEDHHIGSILNYRKEPCCWLLFLDFGILMPTTLILDNTELWRYIVGEKNKEYRFEKPFDHLFFSLVLCYKDIGKILIVIGYQPPAKVGNPG